MSITLTFRTADNTKWGNGKGSNLTATEVDINFWNLAQAIEDIQDNPPTPVSISSVETAGTGMTFVMSDASTIGPIPLPVLKFRYLGAWQPNFAYAVLDTFFVNGFGIFTTQIAHTSGDVFDPDIEISSSPALLQLFGATGFTTDAVLAELADVDLDSSLTDGDFLVFDGGSVGVWRAQAVAEVADAIGAAMTLDDISNVSNAAPAEGDVLTWNGSEWVPEASSGGGGATELVALTDVDIDSTLADGDVLTWHVATEKWIASAPVTGGGGGGGATNLAGLTDVEINSSAAPGDVLTLGEDGKWQAQVPAVSGATHLSGLDDVDITSSIADGDVLTWDSGTGKWIASPSAAGGSGGSGGIEFEDEGAFNGNLAYSPGNVVSSGDLRFVNWADLAAPTSSPSVWSLADSTNVTLGTTNISDDKAVSTGSAIALTPDFNTTGKWYFEMTFADRLNNNSGGGIATAGGTEHAISTFLGGFSCNFTGHGSGGSVGESVGTSAYAVDLTAGLIWFAQSASSPNWNGVSGNPATGTGGISLGTVPSGVSPVFYGNSSGETATLTCTEADFAGTLPTGFAAWSHTGVANDDPADDPDHWIGGASKIAGLTDVDLGSGLADGDVLVYSATAGKFVLVNISGLLGSLMP